MIDTIDRKIVNLMLLDADITNREIATSCKIAVGTVNNRINKLKKLGIIKKKTILVDYEKLGYLIEVLVALKIKKGEFANVAKALSLNPNIFLIMDITGEYDTEILARFHTKRELDSFIKKLQQQPSIDSTRTRLILNIFGEHEIK